MRILVLDEGNDFLKHIQKYGEYLKDCRILSVTSLADIDDSYIPHIIFVSESEILEKSRVNFPRSFIVAVVDYCDDETLQRALSTGADDYIFREADRWEFLAKINTARKMMKVAEKDKEQLEEILFILDNVGSFIWCLQDEETYLTVNKAFVSYFGLNIDKKDVIGRKIFELLRYEDAKIQVENNRRVFQEKKKITTKEWLSVNGDKKLLSVTRIPRLDERGNVDCVVCIANDITKQEKTKNAYLETQKQYKELVENINDVIFKLDLNGRITYISPVVKNFSYHRPDEVIGKHFSAFVYPEDIPLLQRKIELILNGKSEPTKFRVKTKRGEVRYVRTFSKPLIRDGRLYGITGVLTDITPQVENEKLIKRLLLIETTIRRISERFVGSYEMNRAIDDSLADLGRLSGADRCYLFLIDNEKETMTNTNEWCRKGVPSQKGNLQDICIQDFPWWMSQLVKGETIHIRDVSSMPQEAVPEKEMLQRQNIKSLLVFPIFIKEKLAGFIGFDNVTRTGEWEKDAFDILGLSAKIIGSALEHKRIEEELKRNEERFRNIFMQSPIGIQLCSGEGRVVAANNSFVKIFGLKNPHELKACELFEYLNISEEKKKKLLNGKVVRQDFKIDFDALKKRKLFKSSKKGSSYIDCILTPINYDNESISEIMLMAQDITRRKQLENRLRYMSFYDELTGLYNRNYFLEKMKEFQHKKHHPVSLVVIDVDGLKIINDTLGHDAGDSHIRLAAGIIRHCFSKEHVVARIGGDEFAALIPSCDEKEVKRICNQIRENAEQYNEENPGLPLSIAIGYAVKFSLTKTMTELFKEADDSMYREKMHHKYSTKNDIVKLLMKTMEARDYITEGHAGRLEELVVMLAEDVGFADRKIADLKLLAQFHDIGKVGIPDSILLKPGPLTPEEFNEMKRHSEIGYRIAISSPDLSPIADCILKHHEWWNGNGYPLGIKGKEIPVECRILSIADAFDAMTNDRPYRKAMSVEEALTELEKCAGEQFDPELVARFVRLIKNKK